MELNTKGRYAVTAMADLAKYGAGDAVPLSAIAERQQISLAYLEQLFFKLRRAGLVESARGRSGGYRLGRPAASITVAEIMRAVEEGIRMTRCGGEDAPPCMAGQRCLTHGLWDALGDQIAIVPGQRDACRKCSTAFRRQAGRPARPPSRGSPEWHRGMSAGRTYLDWNATAPLRPRGARGHASRRSTSSAIRPRRTPKGAARAPSSRMRASRLQRWSAPSRPRWCSPAAARKPTTPCWRRAGTTIVAVRHRARLGARAGPRRQGAASSRCRWRRNGVVRVGCACRRRCSPAGRVLLSLQMANNETGVHPAGRRDGRGAPRRTASSSTPTPCRLRAASRSICARSASTA